MVVFWKFNCCSVSGKRMGNMSTISGRRMTSFYATIVFFYLHSCIGECQTIIYLNNCAFDELIRIKIKRVKMVKNNNKKNV